MLVQRDPADQGPHAVHDHPDGRALDAVKVMAQHDIGSLVVMEHGRLAGMLTFREVLEALARATACWATCRSRRSTSATR